jgi:hypothetical protein
LERGKLEKRITELSNKIKSLEKISNKGTKNSVLTRQS